MPMSVDPDMEDNLPLLDLDAMAQAALVRSGRVTPEILLDAAIARIERLNPRLNALSFLDAGAARQRVC